MCYVKQSHIPLYLRAARQETDLIFPICSGLRYAPVQIVLFVKYSFMPEPYEPSTRKDEDQQNEIKNEKGGHST